MNKQLTTGLRRAGLGLLFAGGVLLSAGCAVNGRVASGGGGGAVYYDYDYYPGGDFYFYPKERLYYWNEGGHWTSGAQLPSRYHLEHERHEHLRARTREPWNERQREHQEHENEEHGH